VEIKIEEIIWTIEYRPLHCKYKTIFKFKRNGEKLIDG
jgi:hypothetical protein